MDFQFFSWQQLPEAQSFIDDLVDLVTQRNATVGGVRPPDANRQEIMKQWLEKVKDLRGRPLHYPYVGTGKGRGSYVQLLDGSVKLDFINGIGIHILGHAHPEVIRAALLGALEDILMQGHLQLNQDYVRALEKLLQLAKRSSRLRHGWITTCGTMANENALKIARQKTTPARLILAFEGAFAGRSTLMAEITDNPTYKEGLPVYNEVLRLPWFDPKKPSDSVQKAHERLLGYLDQHKGNICVFVFEPMLGEGGYIPAPREFFVPLLETCRQNGIPIWADEVQTFLRTGEPFAFQTLQLGEYVDIVTIAKTAQFGATLYTSEMNPKPGLIAGTFAANSASLKVGLRIMEILDQGGYFGPQGRIQQVHNQFVSGLKALGEGSCQGLIHDVMGLGLMVAFTPLDGQPDRVKAFVQKLFENGLISYTCGKNPLRARFLIPATVTDSELDEALHIIEKTLLSCRHHV